MFTNRPTSIPFAPAANLMHRHGGRIQAMDELPVAVYGDRYIVEGNGTIKRLPAMPAGELVFLRFTGTPTFTNSARLICPGAVDYVVGAGDGAWLLSDGNGVWRVYPIRATATTAPLDALAYMNLAINPDNSVSQEFVDNSITINATGPGASFFLTDMKKAYTQGTYQASYQRVASTLPSAKYSGKITINSAQASLGSADAVHLFQKIEGPRVARLQYGGANAAQCAVVWAVKPSISNQIVNLVLTNSDETRNFIFKATCPAGAWTLVGGVVPGCPDGTWLTADATIGATALLVLGAGSSYFGTVNVWNSGSLIDATSDITNMAATNGATLEEYGPYVFPGTQIPTLAQLPFLNRYPEDTYHLCRRYVRKSFPKESVPAQNFGVNTGELTYIAGRTTTGTDSSHNVIFDPPMMGDPAVTLFNPSAANGQIRDLIVPGDCSGSAASAVKENGFRVSCAGNASSAVGNILGVHWVAKKQL